MSRYDDLFDEFATIDSVFADKSALDSLADPDEIVPRTEQERALARILTDSHGAPSRCRSRGTAH